MKISPKTIKEAVGLAYGIHRMNARNAFCYAFRVGKDNEVTYGEFLFSAEADRVANANEFDGYVQYRTETARNLRTDTIRAIDSAQIKGV